MGEGGVGKKRDGERLKHDVVECVQHYDVVDGAEV